MLLASSEIASAVESTPEGVFTLFLPSSVWPRAQFAEDGHDLHDCIFVRDFGFQLKIGCQFTDAFGDDGNFRFQIRRCGQHDDVETTLQSGGHVVDAAIARIGPWR